MLFDSYRKTDSYWINGYWYLTTSHSRVTFSIRYMIVRDEADCFNRSDLAVPECQTSFGYNHLLFIEKKSMLLRSKINISNILIWLVHDMLSRDAFQWIVCTFKTPSQKRCIPDFCLKHHMVNFFFFFFFFL